MLKMYQQRLHSGGSNALWEEEWREGSFEQALAFCEVDPLRPLFDEYARPGSRMLEGGCGQGQYVAYYASRGVNVVGLDFATETLTRLRSGYPQLPLCAGDVARLPFQNASFDLYYSGGVVEHFESGAEPALLESYRVLRPGGVLLISVPYLSPLRKALSPFKRKHWQRVSSSQTGEAEQQDGLQFFQYIYTPREFEKLLGATGFRVIKKQGYAVLWGLGEIPLLKRVMDKLAQSSSGTQEVASAQAKTVSTETANIPATTRTQNTAASPSLIKRLAVSEDDSVPVLGLGVRALRWACSNMMMYVCVRREDK